MCAHITTVASNGWPMIEQHQIEKIKYGPHIPHLFICSPNLSTITTLNPIKFLGR